jgi:hypothetical protein
MMYNLRHMVPQHGTILIIRIIQKQSNYLLISRRMQMTGIK